MANFQGAYPVPGTRIQNLDAVGVRANPLVGVIHEGLRNNRVFLVPAEENGQLGGFELVVLEIRRV